MPSSRALLTPCKGLMPSCKGSMGLVGIAIVTFAPLVAIAQTLLDAPRKDATEVTTPDDTPPPGQPSMEESIRAAIEAAEQLESADSLQWGNSPDLRTELLDKIKTYTGIIQASDPTNPWLDYVVAYVYTASGRYGDAIAHLETFVNTREGRNHWRAHRMLGDLLVNQYPRLAKASYVKAKALKRNEPTVLFGLSRCTASTGDLDAAIDLAERVVTIDEGRTIRYIHYLTQLLMEDSRWRDAQRRALQAIALAEHEAVANLHGTIAPLQGVESGGDSRAKLQQLEAELELGMEVVSGIMRADPAEEDAYLLAAHLISKRAGNAQKISKLVELGILETGIEKVGERASVRLLEAYAVSLAEVGRNDDAIRAFEKLLLKDAANLTAGDWLARLRREKDANSTGP